MIRYFSLHFFEEAVNWVNFMRPAGVDDEPGRFQPGEPLVAAATDQLDETSAAEEFGRRFAFPFTFPVAAR
jgi:hypothetical protein